MYLRSPRRTHPIIGVATCLSGAIILWYYRPLPVDHQTHENYTQPSNCTGKSPTGTASVLRNNIFRRRSRWWRRKGQNEGTAIRPTTCYIADTRCGYCAREDGENTQIKWRVLLALVPSLSGPSFHRPMHTISSLTLPPSHHCNAPSDLCILYILLHITKILYLPIFNNHTIELYLPPPHSLYQSFFFYPH